MYIRIYIYIWYDITFIFTCTCTFTFTYIHRYVRTHVSDISGHPGLYLVVLSLRYWLGAVEPWPETIASVQRWTRPLDDVWGVKWWVSQVFFHKFSHPVSTGSLFDIWSRTLRIWISRHWSPWSRQNPFPVILNIFKSLPSNHGVGDFFLNIKDIRG